MAMHKCFDIGNCAAIFVNMYGQVLPPPQKSSPRATLKPIVGCIYDLPNMAVNIYCVKLYSVLLLELFSDQCAYTCRVSMIRTSVSNMRSGVRLQASTRKFHCIVLLVLYEKQSTWHLALMVIKHLAYIVCIINLSAKCFMLYFPYYFPYL